MLNLIVRRVLGMLPTLILVVALVFMLIHLVPGDPVEALLGDRASPADREALRVALGLNLPLHVQFTHFIYGLPRGDWGVSMVSGKPVLETLLGRLPATGWLALWAMVVVAVWGTFLGILGAIGRPWLRESLDQATLAMVAVPSFVVGPLLIVGVSVKLGWLPVSGAGSWDSVVLPAITLGLGMSAVLARMLTASLKEQTHADYMRTAMAKGMPFGEALFRHALRNALLPTVQVVFLQVGMLLTGAVLTEAIFGWPGLGNLLVDALHQRDYPVMQGCLLLISLVYMLALLFADMVSALLDPRVRPWLWF